MIIPKFIVKEVKDTLNIDLQKLDTIEQVPVTLLMMYMNNTGSEDFDTFVEREALEICIDISDGTEIEFEKPERKFYGFLTDEGYYINDNDYAFATYAFATDNADELTLEEALELLEDKDIDTIVEVK